MSEWVSELLSGWVSEWKREWVSKWVGEWVEEGVSEWVSWWGSEWVSEWVSKWVSEWVRGWVNYWVGGWVGGWGGGWVVGGWVSGWVSDWVGVFRKTCIHANKHIKMQKEIKQKHIYVNMFNNITEANTWKQTLVHIFPMWFHFPMWSSSETGELKFLSILLNCIWLHKQNCPCVKRAPYVIMVKNNVSDAV